MLLRRQLAGLVVALVLLASCAQRAGLPDGGESIDAGTPDSGAFDAGALDGGALDGGALDGGALDAGSLDAGPLDAGPLDAGPLDAGSLDAGSLGAPRTILLTVGYQLNIYDLAGNVLQTIPVPAAHREAGEGLRGVAEDAAGRIHIFAGTFNPRLATWDGSAWTSRPIGGTANNVHYGHVATVGNVVLSTGMNIAFTRYDADTQVTDYVMGGEYVDVVHGADGRLYAVDAFDETVELDAGTLARIRTLPISPSPDLIGVDVSGVVHGAWTQSGQLFTFPANGSTPTMSSSLGIMDFEDIDVATDGTVIFCGGGKLVITDLGVTHVVTKTLPFTDAFCSFGYTPR